MLLERAQHRIRRSHHERSRANPASHIVARAGPFCRRMRAVYATPPGEHARMPRDQHGCAEWQRSETVLVQMHNAGPKLLFNAQQPFTSEMDVIPWFPHPFQLESAFMQGELGNGVCFLSLVPVDRRS